VLSTTAIPIVDIATGSAAITSTAIWANDFVRGEGMPTEYAELERVAARAGGSLRAKR